MDTAKKFEKYRYVHLKKLLDKKRCKELTEALEQEAANRGWFDPQCPTSKSIRDSEIFDQLLVDMLPKFEAASGLKLLPTYAYARWYVPGETLKIHRDRESCEVSATVTLGFKGKVWPIFMGTPSEEKTKVKRYNSDNDICYVKNVGKIEMEVGEGAMYRGCELYHWRDEYTQGKWQAQVFLHYVDANGPNAEWIYDKRGKLNLPRNKNGKNAYNDNVEWYYTENLSEQNCDDLLNYYTNPDNQYELKNKKLTDFLLKNVDAKFFIDKEIKEKLTAIAISGNASRKWNFSVTKSGDVEFFTHDTETITYLNSLDSVTLNTDSFDECKKLTTITFLNDDFVAGQFFIQLGEQKIYPKQSKGTILVFPSFLTHGFEPVTDGKRNVIVSSLIGPWYK